MTLTARIRALMRRNHPSGETLAHGDLGLDAEALMATRGGREMALTRREEELLELPEASRTSGASEAALGVERVAAMAAGAGHPRVKYPDRSST